MDKSIQESHYDLSWQVLDKSSYHKDPMSQVADLLLMVGVYLICNFKITFGFNLCPGQGEKKIVNNLMIT
jgi:hypothetical protein